MNEGSLFLFVKCFISILSYETQWNKHANVPCYDSVSIGLKSFIKWKNSVFSPCFYYAINNSCVLSDLSIHKPCFQNINWATNDTGCNTSNCWWNKMAWNSIFHNISSNKCVLDLIKCSNLCSVNYWVSNNVRTETCPETSDSKIKIWNTLLMRRFFCKRQ